MDGHFIFVIFSPILGHLLPSYRWRGGSTFHCKWGWTERLRAEALRRTKTPLVLYERDIENIVAVAARSRNWKHCQRGVGEILKTSSSATTRTRRSDLRCSIKGWGLEGWGGKGRRGGDGGCNNGSLVLADREIVICARVAMCTYNRTYIFQCFE